MAISQVIIFSVLYIVVSSQVQDSNNKKIIFTRHGARSPNKFTDMDAQLWDIEPGLLTEKGFKQLIRLGNQFSNSIYMDSNDNCIYEKFHIEASTKQRVIMSTIGFITGLCPNNYAEILRRYFAEYYSIYSTDQDKLNEILQSDFKDPGKFDYDIFVRDDDFLFHGHDGAVCPILDIIYDDLLLTNTHKQYENAFKEKEGFDEILQLMQQASPSKNITKESVKMNQVKTFYGGYNCNNYEGYKFPNPSPKALALMKEAGAYIFYDIDNSQRVQHLAALTDIFKWVIQELESDALLSWYSGHDSNQVAILSVLSNEKYLPPFGSYIELEVYGDVVNLYNNGVRQHTNMCARGINCRKVDVVNYLKQYISNDLESLCAVKP